MSSEAARKTTMSIRSRRSRAKLPVVPKSNQTMQAVAMPVASKPGPAPPYAAATMIASM